MSSPARRAPGRHRPDDVRQKRAWPSSPPLLPGQLASQINQLPLPLPDSQTITIDMGWVNVNSAASPAFLPPMRPRAGTTAAPALGVLPRCRATGPPAPRAPPPPPGQRRLHPRPPRRTPRAPPGHVRLAIGRPGLGRARLVLPPRPRRIVRGDRRRAHPPRAGAGAGRAARLRPLPRLADRAVSMLSAGPACSRRGRGGTATAPRPAPARPRRDGPRRRNRARDDDHERAGR